MKEQPPEGVEFATLDLRLGAAMIDLGILLLIAAVVLGLISEFIPNLGSFGNIISAAFSIALLFSYHGYFNQGPWQATPGKRILKIHLIIAGGKKLEWNDSLKRIFVEYGWSSAAGFMLLLIGSTTRFFDMLVIIQTIASVIMIWKSADRTGIHDKICGTWVVRGVL